MKTTTVLTIIGEPLVQQMLAVNLQQMGSLVAWEEDVEKARDALQSVTPDLIILDSDCVPENRNRQAEQLYGYARSSGIPVITLVGQPALFGDGDKVWRGETVNKPFAPRQLVAMVGLLLRREVTNAQNVCLCAGAISLNPLTYRVSHGETEIALRPKEFRLLAFLMKHVDRVFNRGQLLDELWGGDVFVDERTVDVIVRRLRAALEPHGLSEWIETVRGAGYRFRAG